MLDGVLWAARPSGELVDGVEELQRLKARAAALEAELLAEVDAREVAKRELAWSSTADWFTHLAGTTRRQGKRAVGNARRLVAARERRWRPCARAPAPDQADLILDAVEQLPLTGDLRTRGEAGAARQRHPARRQRPDPCRPPPHRGHRPRPNRPRSRGRPGPRRTRRSPRSAAHHHRGRRRRRPGSRPRHHRGRRQPPRRPPALTKPTPTGHAACGEDEDPRDHGRGRWTPSRPRSARPAHRRVPDSVGTTHRRGHPRRTRPRGGGRCGQGRRRLGDPRGGRESDGL